MKLIMPLNTILNQAFLLYLCVIISGSISYGSDISIFIMLLCNVVLSFRFKVIITTIVNIGPSILTYGCIIFVSVYYSHTLHFLIFASVYYSHTSHFLRFVSFYYSQTSHFLCWYWWITSIQRHIQPNTNI